MKNNKPPLRKRGALIAAAGIIAAVLISCSAARPDLTSAGNASSFSRASSPAVVSDASEFYKTLSSPVSSGTQNATETDGIRYYFPRAGQKAQPVLIGIIGSAKQTLDVAIYSFTDKAIASALVKAKARGVSVRIITDRTQAGTRSQKNVLKQVTGAGIPVKVDTHEGIMHLKMTIADGKTATTGSFNYTQAAENFNDEVFVVIGNSKIAQDFDKEFSSMWNDSGKFQKYP